MAAAPSPPPSSLASFTASAPADDLKNWDAEFGKVDQVTLFDPHPSWYLIRDSVLPFLYIHFTAYHTATLIVITIVDSIRLVRLCKF
jgi:hypothetical protein